MTQPAKVQEPSMEEILASIRRIIADDEAKPPAAEKSASAEAPAKPEKQAAAAPAAKAPVMNDIPPSAIPAAQAAAAKTAPPPATRARSHLPPSRRQPCPTARTTSTRCWTASMKRPLRRKSGRPPDAEVFELTDDMALPERRSRRSRRSIRRTISNLPKCRRQHRNRQPAFEPPPLESSPAAPPQQILSRSTVSAVESAFNTLAHTVLSNNARTLEDLVKEMLRPMLKSWLDDNLPGLVERIVKAEIERVSRGGR